MLEELFSIPKNQRNPEWVQQFFMAIQDAPLFVLNPQRLVGPDEFPYFRLALGAEGEDIHPCTLSEVLEYCTENGLGIVLTQGDAEDEQPLWVFSLGNLVSLRLHGRFDGDPVDLEDIQKPASDAGGAQQVMIGTPSGELLPDYCRHAMRKWLISVVGWKNPEMVLLISPHMRPTRNIMLNLPGDAFRDNDHIREFLARISWFLPPGRGLMIAHPDLLDHPQRQPL